MSNYELALTAGEIDIALQKAHNPDTSPQATDNLVTSGGVKTYVDNALVSGSLYPVGSVYLNATNSANPSTLLGFGTWVAFGAGRVPVGIDPSQSEFNTAEETGGAKNHTLTTAEIPSHIHNLGTFGNSARAGSAIASAGSSTQPTQDTTATGGGQPHNNLQPYIVVYMWKRTA